jgi:hypothetical protein
MDQKAVTENTTASASESKIPPVLPQDKETDEDIRAMMEDEPDVVNPENGPEVSTVPQPLTHNPLHELESSWWLLLYILAMRIVATFSSDWNRSAQSKQLHAVFPAVEFGPRTTFFTKTGSLSQLTDTFDTRIRDPCLQNLEPIRIALVKAFVAAEATLPESVDTTQWNMRRKLFTVFENSIQTLQQVPWPKMKQWPATSDQSNEQPVKKRRISVAPSVAEPSSPTPSRPPVKISPHAAK